MEYPSFPSKSCVVSADRVQFLLKRYRGGLFPMLSLNVLKNQRLRRSLYIGGYTAIVKSSLSQNKSLNNETRFSHAYQKPLICQGLIHLPLNLFMTPLRGDRSLFSVEVIHWARPKHCVIAYQLENLVHKAPTEPKQHHIVALSPLKPSNEEHGHWEDLILSRDNQVVTKIPL